jgi:hypothetical protein
MTELAHILPNERNAQMRDAIDFCVDSVQPFRCSYCREMVEASELADAAADPEVKIMTCVACVDRKRETNNRYAQSFKGKLTNKKSRSKHRFKQRKVEYERRKKKRALARGVRPTEDVLREMIEEWKDDSDVDDDNDVKVS